MASTPRHDTIITTVGTAIVKETRGQPAGRSTLATASAFTDTTGRQQARIIADTIRSVDHVESVVASQYDNGRVIFRGVSLAGGVMYALAHQLNRAWVGFRIETPGGTAGFGPLWQAATAQFPATAFLLLQSPQSGTCDVVVW